MQMRSIVDKRRVEEQIHVLHLLMIKNQEYVLHPVAKISSAVKIEGIGDEKSNT